MSRRDEPAYPTMHGSGWTLDPESEFRPLRGLTIREEAILRAMRVVGPMILSRSADIRTRERHLEEGVFERHVYAEIARHAGLLADAVLAVLDAMEAKPK